MTQIATSLYRHNATTGQVEFNLELTNGVPENDRAFVEQVSIGIVGAMQDYMEAATARAGGGALAKFLTTGPIFAVGLTLESLAVLKSERDLNGEQGLQAKITTIAQVGAGTVIAGLVAEPILVATGAGIIATVAIGAVVGLITDKAFDAKFFSDSTTSASDKLGTFINNFDTPQFKNDLFLISESGPDLVVQSAKSFLDGLVADSHTISTHFQSLFNSLSTAEATEPRRYDPLTLDLDGDGIDLIALKDSKAFFDLDISEVLDSNGKGTGTYISDGVKEQVGWVKGDDGFLILDKNNNNQVDNVLELFGKQNKTGTEELREYDLNLDNKIYSSGTYANLDLESEMKIANY